MLTVIIGMLVALVLAAVVLALVAVPARRAGREVLTSQGEQLITQARERAGEAVGAARERVGELADRLPVTRPEAGRTAPQTIDLRDTPEAGSAPRERSSRRR